MPNMWVGGKINKSRSVCVHRARQEWAMSDVHGPRDGFESGSIYSNLAFLLSSVKKFEIPI